MLGGDILKAINGQEVSSESEIARILLLSRPEDTLMLRFLRDDQWLEVVLPLEAMHSR